MRRFGLSITRRLRAGPVSGLQRVCHVGVSVLYGLPSGVTVLRTACLLGPAENMRTSRRIITLLLAVIGVSLIVRGIWGGAWPPSVQFIAGIVLLVLAVLRWRSIV
jgi:hypothetical protein